MKKQLFEGRVAGGTPGGDGVVVSASNNVAFPVLLSVFCKIDSKSDTVVRKLMVCYIKSIFFQNTVLYRSHKMLRQYGFFDLIKLE